MAALRERFHAAHERLYGYALRNAPVELVNLRVTATVPLPKAQSADGRGAEGSVDVARIGERQIYFGRASSGSAQGTKGSAGPRRPATTGHGSARRGRQRAGDP